MTSTAIQFKFEFYVTSFCGARTRAILELALSVLPGSRLIENDLSFEPDQVLSSAARIMA
jgi:hypothetical protein